MENWETEKAEKENDVEFLRNAMSNLAKECCELKQENKLLKEESRQVAQESIHTNIDIEVLEDKLEEAKRFVRMMAEWFLEVYIKDV